MGSASRQHVIVTPVRPDRREDFERFVREVAVPAVERAAPDQAGRWRLTRATPVAEDEQDANQQDASARTDYAFIFEGGDLSEWELGPLLAEAYGPVGGAEQLTRLEEMLDGEQRGWTLQPVLP